MHTADERKASELNRRQIGLPGSAMKGVFTAAEFSKLLERGRSREARGDVLVIGNGSDAIDAARAALRAGAEKATVVCMGPDADMVFSVEEAAEAKREGVRIVHGWVPTSIAGHTDGRVSGAFFKRCDRVFDDGGHFAPKYDAKSTMAQYCDTLVLAGA